MTKKVELERCAKQYVYFIAHFRLCDCIETFKRFMDCKYPDCDEWIELLYLDVTMYINK